MAAYWTAFRIISRRRKRNQISKKILKDLHNPFSMEEDAFKIKFSLNQNGVHYLAALLTPIMKRNQGYPVEVQILTSLQVLTSGQFQNRVGEDQIICVSQATVSRSLDAFLDAILEIEPTLIEFPSLSELALAEPKLYGQSKIPNIIGVVDCIPVLIQKPHAEDHSLYLNRKKEYAINVQLVCDSELYILDAVVHWPGSLPNSVIWSHSNLRSFLQENTSLMPNKSFILGDCSYPLEPWLLVPYEDCIRSDQLIFNDHVSRALNVMTTCEATLRARFKSIHHNRGPLYYAPEKCSKIIAACVILHNICVKMNISLCEPIDLDDDVLHKPDCFIDSDDVEETMMRYEGMCIRDEIARKLI